MKKTEKHSGEQKNKISKSKLENVSGGRRRPPMSIPVKQKPGTNEGPQIKPIEIIP